MTTPKEALELKLCPFCGGEAESDSQRGYRNISTGNPENAAAIYCTKCSAGMTWCYRDTPEIERDQVMTLLTEQWNTRATSSLEGDAVERAARIIDPHFRDPMALSLNEYRTEQAITKARAILATGLVPDEAAIRADEREKCEKDKTLAPDEVEWVVNDIAELGVKIGNQFFFLYKGSSLVYGTDDISSAGGFALNEDTDPPTIHKWRPVFKREFGECCHPVNRIDPTRIGTVSLDDSDDWKPLPAAIRSGGGE